MNEGLGQNVVRDKSFLFARQIVFLYKYLCDIKHEYVMSKQLLRSGTAIGALVREAQNAESKQDFIHKLGIAQKECDETRYWLDLLYATDILTEDEYQSIYNEADEILRLLISIILSSKKNLKSGKT